MRFPTLILFALIGFLLCSCADSWSTVGEAAASQMHLPFYVEFQRDGKPDSAAMFYWRGCWWVYHPAIGSKGLVLTDPDSIPSVAVLAIPGASGPITVKPTPANVPWQPLNNGCLPRAIAECQQHGGGISIEPHHARYVP